MYKCTYCGRYLKEHYEVCPGCGSNKIEKTEELGEKIIK